MRDEMQKQLESLTKRSQTDIDHKLISLQEGPHICDNNSRSTEIHIINTKTDEWTDDSDEDDSDDDSDDDESDEDSDDYLDSDDDDSDDGYGSDEGYEYKANDSDIDRRIAEELKLNHNKFKQTMKNGKGMTRKRRRKKRRRSSNLFRTKSGNKWKEEELEQQKKEMQQQMIHLVTHLNTTSFCDASLAATATTTTISSLSSFNETPL
eukprot:165661_1